jgi:hypothetical protein
MAQAMAQAMGCLLGQVTDWTLVMAMVSWRGLATALGMALGMGCWAGAPEVMGWAQAQRWSTQAPWCLMRWAP